MSRVRESDVERFSKQNMLITRTFIKSITCRVDHSLFIFLMQIFPVIRSGVITFGITAWQRRSVAIPERLFI